MDAVRTINKYPNRRLYDTAQSRYITLSDIHTLVLDEQDFEVIDRKSGRDITRNILLHVIVEQAEHGESAISRDFLKHIIRAFNGQLPQTVHGYLEGSLGLFLEQHRQASEAIDSVTGTAPLTAMTDLAHHHLGQWLDLQKQMLRAFHPQDTGASS